MMQSVTDGQVGIRVVTLPVASVRKATAGCWSGVDLGQRSVHWVELQFSMTKWLLSFLAVVILWKLVGSYSGSICPVGESQQQGKREAKGPGSRLGSSSWAHGAQHQSGSLRMSSLLSREAWTNIWDIAPLRAGAQRYLEGHRERSQCVVITLNLTTCVCPA